MNTSVEGIIVNNCQYAPIYLIQDPGATQANTYVLTPSAVEQPKPVSNNLKAFYENSGNIENGLANVEAPVRPTVVKKKESVLIGNNLKLASFLLPKNENGNKQYVIDNIVLKPNVSTTTTSNSVPINTIPMSTVTVNTVPINTMTMNTVPMNTVTMNTVTMNTVPMNTVPMNTIPMNTVPLNTLPKIDMDRKIVKLKEVPTIKRPEKRYPKIKPKENAPCPTVSKHTSVQLIKLGETYHSLNHLSESQIKMVNQALKMFKDPDKTTAEPTTKLDPVTNTQYIYKIVSSKDLAVAGQKKFIVKEKKLTKIPKRVVEERLKQMVTFKDDKDDEEFETVSHQLSTKFTRSGRKVKLPRPILPEDSLHRSKKKSGTVISCFQCSAEFGSLYRLQKHYENQPTHIPAKIHSNLFHCLLAIIKSGSEGNKTNIFIQQLEQLILKLKSLLPCLLKKVDGSGGQSCTINDDIGRLFGMSPGKYNIDVEALNCVKDKNGYCIHNPPKVTKSKDNKPSILSKHSDHLSNLENDSENCARINSVAKWPTVSKRIWKIKQKTHEAKKMRLKSECDTLIDLGTEDFGFKTEDINTASTVTAASEDDVTKLLASPQDANAGCPPLNNCQSQSNNFQIPAPNKPKHNYVQFHSAHFDIRSSPIKSTPSPTGFRKFQIDPSKFSNYQAQVIRSLDMVDKDNKKPIADPDSSLHIPISSSDNNLRVTLPNTKNGLHCHVLPGSANGLNVTLPNSNTNLHVSLANCDNAMHVTLPTSNNALNVSLPASDNRLNITLPVSDSGLNVSLPLSDNNINVTIPATHNDLTSCKSLREFGNLSNMQNSVNGLQISIPNSENGLHVSLPNMENSLDIPIPNTEDSLDISLPNSENNLHDIFQDDAAVSLSCKDSNIDPDLKEWLISTSDKSQQSFTKSNSLIEPAFLHVSDSGDKSLDKNVIRNGDMPSLDASDNRLLPNQGESVLNFLETLGNELVYPETEIRNNGVDFQLDGWTFHST